MLFDSSLLMTTVFDSINRLSTGEVVFEPLAESF